jgi:hypothetical protein
MAEIDSYNNVWKFETKIVGEDTDRTEIDWESQTRYDVPTVTEIASDGQKVPVKRKQITLIPPRRTTPSYISSRFGNVVMSKPTQPIDDMTNIKTNLSAFETRHPSTVNQNDPVYIMMDRSKKIDTEVEMKLVISLPQERLYNVAKESFDDGGEKALNYIIENIDISKIKEALKAGIKARYEKIDYIEPDYAGDDALMANMYKPTLINPEDLTLK